MSMIPSVIAGLALSVSVLLPAAAHSQNHTLKPVGEYAKIDTRVTNETIRILRRGPDELRNQRITDIQSRPQDYAPPVFYALSEALFQRGDRDDGAFWFYAGQLRARFDANRCTDPTAGQAVDALTQQFGPAINQYMFQDLAKLEALIPRVVEWDRNTPHNYEHRWINLSGTDAVQASLEKGPPNATRPLSHPEDQWDRIAERTRREYLAGFRQAMQQAKKGS
jgi:hypothetical protein